MLKARALTASLLPVPCGYIFIRLQLIQCLRVLCKIEICTGQTFAIIDTQQPSVCNEFVLFLSVSYLKFALHC